MADFVGVDYQDLIGASGLLSVSGLKKAIGAIRTNASLVTNQGEADKWVSMASRFAEVMQAGMAEKLDMASKAGLQPTRYIGIDSVIAVPLGTALAVNVNTNEDARIIGFRTDATWAIDFLINQIAIGNRNHIIGNAGVPATAFVTGVSLPPMQTPIMKAGAGSVVTVFNRAAVNRVFNALYSAIPVGDEACSCACS